MMNLDGLQQDLFNELGDTGQWCRDQYDTFFAKYFEGVPELYKNITSKSRKMTDDEVEWILTTLPLQLMAVSEQLSQYKLNLECLKLYIKKREAEFISNSDTKTVTQKKQEASLDVMEYQVLSKAYSCVVSRVENEVNFARELVMFAKKIWDSRRKVYEANPVNPVDLEDYSYDSK